ncbi:MAG: hypothetical protein ACTHZM_09880 [Canibacter sp.]
MHHGGVGAVAAVLSMGTRQVIKPFLGDQCVWMRCDERVGVAVPLRVLRTEVIAVPIITEIDTITSRAQALAQETKNEHGVATEIDRLERIVLTACES